MLIPSDNKRETVLLEWKLLRKCDQEKGQANNDTEVEHWGAGTNPPQKKLGKQNASEHHNEIQRKSITATAFLKHL